MRTIQERMVVVWNDNGSFRGAHLDERFVYDDNSTRNAQRPLTEQEADELIGTVEASLISQTKSLTSERDDALAQLQQLTQQIVALQARIDELTAVPTTPTISSRQGKLVLLKAGLLDTVKAAVAAADETVQIYWSDSVEWHRNDTVLRGMAHQLGLTDEQIDTLFAQAATL